MRLPFNGSYPTTQTFNDPCCRASYAQFGMVGHNGIDYGLPVGTPVVAVENGTIRSGYEPNGYGRYIFLTNDTGTQFVYGHLSLIQIASGRVSAGQQIGLSGNTGNSSGPHLHFGIRPPNSNNNNGFLGYVDPLPYFKGNSTMQNGSQATSDNIVTNLAFEGMTNSSPTKADLEYHVGKRTVEDTLRKVQTSDRAKRFRADAVYGQQAIRDNWEQQINDGKKAIAENVILKEQVQSLQEQLSKASFTQADRDVLNRVDKNTGGQ